MMLLLRDPQEHQLPARIVKVEKEMVTLDLNHPLAGKDLTFELKVVGINEAGSSEDHDCACGEKEEEKEEEGGCCGGCGEDCECK
jgi:FKBP-type peptidyl-prolyl cis-trans isomerase 2